jgi:hypothetical protein
MCRRDFSDFFATLLKRALAIERLIVAAIYYRLRKDFMIETEPLKSLLHTSRYTGTGMVVGFGSHNKQGGQDGIRGLSWCSGSR